MAQQASALRSLGEPISSNGPAPQEPRVDEFAVLANAFAQLDVDDERVQHSLAQLHALHSDGAVDADFDDAEFVLTLDLE